MSENVDLSFSRANLKTCPNQHARLDRLPNSQRVEGRGVAAKPDRRGNVFAGRLVFDLYREIAGAMSRSCRD